MGKAEDLELLAERTRRNKAKFIDRYLELGSIGATMEALGVRRQLFAQWCREDPEFKRVYYEELLPARRDKVISQVYRLTQQKQGVFSCPVCLGAGKLESKVICHGCHGKGWIEVRSDMVQLTAGFGFLKATDHLADPYDQLLFIDKHALEIAGSKDAEPVRLTVKIVRPDGRQPTKAPATRTADTKTNTDQASSTK